jgi:hypothetical protein
LILGKARENLVLPELIIEFGSHDNTMDAAMKVHFLETALLNNGGNGHQNKLKPD